MQVLTPMCEVEAIMNNRPLTKVSDGPNDIDVITPNHPLLSEPPANMLPGLFNEKDVYSWRRWRQIQYLIFANLFLRRWTEEYLPTLQRRQKWLQLERSLAVGDVVLIVDILAPRDSWLMCVSLEIYEGAGDRLGVPKSKPKL